MQLEEEELSGRDILFEIEDLLPAARKAAWLRFWKAGAGNEYWYKALELIEDYGERKYEEGYHEGYEEGKSGVPLTAEEEFGEQKGS